MHLVDFSSSCFTLEQEYIGSLGLIKILLKQRHMLNHLHIVQHHSLSIDVIYSKPQGAFVLEFIDFKLYLNCL